MTGGIYEIVNRQNGKRYIGSAKNFDARWRLHRASLRRGDHHSRTMLRAWNKYGPDLFDFKKLLICEDKNLLMYEQIYLDACRPEYNNCKIAGSQLGVKRSPESRQKMSDIWKTRPMSDAQKAHLMRITEGNRGKTKVISPSQREKIASALRGRASSPEANRKRSKTLTGRTFSEETIAKMSAARKRYWERKKQP